MLYAALRAVKKTYQGFFEDFTVRRIILLFLLIGNLIFSVIGLGSIVTLSIIEAVTEYQRYFESFLSGESFESSIDWDKLLLTVEIGLETLTLLVIFCILELFYTFFKILREEIRDSNAFEPFTRGQEILFWPMLVIAVFFLVPSVILFIQIPLNPSYDYESFIRDRMISGLLPPYWDILDWSLFLGFRIFPLLVFIFFWEPVIETFLINSGIWRKLTKMNSRKEAAIWVMYFSAMVFLVFLGACLTSIITVGIDYREFLLRATVPVTFLLYNTDALDLCILVVCFFFPLSCFLFIFDPLIEFILDRVPWKWIQRIFFASLFGIACYGYFYHSDDIYNALLWFVTRVVEIHFDSEFKLFELSFQTFEELFGNTPTNLQVQIGVRTVEGFERFVSDADGILMNHITSTNYIVCGAALSVFFFIPTLAVCLIRLVRLTFPNLAFLRFVLYFFIVLALGNWASFLSWGCYIDGIPKTVWNPFLVHIIILVYFLFAMFISDRFDSKWQLFVFLFLPAVEIFLLNLVYSGLVAGMPDVFEAILPEDWLSIYKSSMKNYSNPQFLYDSLIFSHLDAMVFVWGLLVFGFLDSLLPFEKKSEAWLPESSIHARVLLGVILFLTLFHFLFDYSNFWVLASHWSDLSAEEVISIKGEYLDFEPDTKENLIDRLAANNEWSFDHPTLLGLVKPIAGFLVGWLLFGLIAGVVLYAISFVPYCFVRELKTWVNLKKLLVYAIHFVILLDIVYPIAITFGFISI